MTYLLGRNGSDDSSRVIPWMPNLVNQDVSLQTCATAAVQNGYPGFALQDGGQCFGSAQMMQTYSQLGQGNCRNSGNSSLEP